MPPVKRPTCPRHSGVALLDAWCGSRWRLSAGPAAGRKVRVFGLSGRRQLPVSPAPAPGGAAAAWWSLPVPLVLRAPGPGGGRCRWVDRGPWVIPVAVQAAWSPPLQCWGARACTQPFWPLCGVCSHRCPRLCPHAPVSPRGRKLGRPPGGSGCSQSWGEAGGPWWRRVPLGLTAARLPGGPLPGLDPLGPAALPGCPAHRTVASARLPML